MTVEDGWRDKSVVKIKTKPSLTPSLTYKVLYPHLYCETCNADCYICVYDDKYIAAHSKGEGWYDTEFINIFAWLIHHLSHSPSITKKKSQGTPELLVLLFPLVQNAMVLDNIDVITLTKDHLVLLLWESSHYAVL